MVYGIAVGGNAVLNPMIWANYFGRGFAGTIRGAAIYVRVQALTSIRCGLSSMPPVPDEAKIKTKAAIFSIPDFSTFCTSIELPPMTEKEIEQAVYYAAPQYIPLPIAETTLDWRVVGGTPGDKNSPLKIFLIAIPKQIVQGYQKIAQSAGLELYALEAETLALARALVKSRRFVVDDDHIVQQLKNPNQA